jgi:tetrapyrrole methylase family protein/MazG family protein
MLDQSAQIVILGLGPGEAKYLTREAWAVLENAVEVFLRTNKHPSVAELPPHLRVYSFDHLYQKAASFEEVYRSIVEEVIRLGRRPQGVVYAVPGHPFVAEATTPAILKQAEAEGITTRVVDGVSFLEPLFSALRIDPLPMLSIVDALDLASLHVPTFPPHLPAVIVQLYSPQVAADVKLTLMEAYPPEHAVKFVHHAGTRQEVVEELALYEMDQSRRIDWMSSLYVPALDKEASFEAFQEVVAHLRSPEGCPWDREQDHMSLRPYLLEETYELLDAMDKGDVASMKEELGDLLLQVLLHAQIAHEEGEFELSDVLRYIHHKLVKRHPHVFGDVMVANSGEVLRNWEQIKAIERVDNGNTEGGMLDSIPRALPALSQAEQIQRRAARVGFDWKEISGVLQKLREEITELEKAGDEQKRAEEFGDVLFSMVNVARWMNVDAESALRESNERFARRFRFIEAAAREQKKNLQQMTLEEMEALWEEAKRKEQQG